jgi:hypothetical protein
MNRTMQARITNDVPTVLERLNATTEEARQSDIIAQLVSNVDLTLTITSGSTGYVDTISSTQLGVGIFHTQVVLGPNQVVTTVIDPADIVGANAALW